MSNKLDGAELPTVNGKEVARMEKTLRVYLADAPTDVLERLVDFGPTSGTDLVAHFEEVHGDGAKYAASGALQLLHQIGYVQGTPASWQATPDGIAAIAAARSAAG